MADSIDRVDIGDEADRDVSTDLDLAIDQRMFEGVSRLML
jgi:hypothetical protein